MQSGGDTVAFVVTSTVEGEFHIHGYALEWDVTPDQEVVAWFKANATERFPLEVHSAGDEEGGVPAGYLNVNP